MKGFKSVIKQMDKSLKGDEILQRGYMKDANEKTVMLKYLANELVKAYQGNMIEIVGTIQSEAKFKCLSEDDNSLLVRFVRSGCFLYELETNNLDHSSFFDN